MSKKILMISSIDGAEHCAAAIAEQIGQTVEVATDRRKALTLLRKDEFAVVVVEESMAESDPQWADQVWELAQLAIPLQLNFAISGASRLAREVRSALLRRDGEKAVARRAAMAEVENDLKSSVTGLLLESQLALREPAISPTLEPRLRNLVELAGVLRERLRGAPTQLAEGTR